MVCGAILLYSSTPGLVSYILLMLSICTCRLIQPQCVLDTEHLVFGKATLDSEVEKEFIEIGFIVTSMLLSIPETALKACPHKNLYMNVYDNVCS